MISRVLQFTYTDTYVIPILIGAIRIVFSKTSSLNIRLQSRFKFFLTELIKTLIFLTTFNLSTEVWKKNSRIKSIVTTIVSQNSMEIEQNVTGLF